MEIKFVASTYYWMPSAHVPYIIELTREYGEEPLVFRFADASMWNRSIDALGIRFDQCTQIDPDLHSHDIHYNCERRPAWHPSYPLPSTEAVK